MDEYLKCLYNYILEVRMTDTLQKTLEYQALRKCLLQALDGMDAALTGEQKQAVENFLSAKAQISIREDEWLFREGVALGKWLSQA